MKRTYSNQESQTAELFCGIEVEHTPAYGMKTLFVVGCLPSDQVADAADRQGVSHIFFGANHSFSWSNSTWPVWEKLICDFLDREYLCTLDIPVIDSENLLESRVNEYDNFIPQIRIPLPYIQQWNYNTTVKLDDSGFSHSNPGVWCHSLHDLRSRETFTPWCRYKEDVIV